MKKVINNKLYDTGKAELVVTFKRRRESQIFKGLYHWAGAELYKTKKGNWFEVVGTDPADARKELNALSEEEAKETIRLYPDLFQELYPDEVEEA